MAPILEQRDSAPQSGLSFADDEARQHAFQQWRIWSSLNLQSPLFGPLDAIEGTTL